MSRAVRRQHTPRRGASHSRRAGLRWRRPRAARQPWTRTLRRARQALGSPLSRIEASARVIEAAARFAPSRPFAATKQILLVALWLSEAVVHLDRAARGLQETTEWIAITGAPADVPQRITDSTFQWIDASRRLLDVSNRLDTTFAQFCGAVTGGVIRFESPSPAFATDVVTSDAIVARDGNGAPLLFIVEPRAAAAAVAGARKISRGRAPPLLSTCTL